MQICQVSHDKAVISFQNKNNILLYQYEDENMVKSIFDKTLNIPIDGSSNYVCFEDGYHHYIATSGLKPKFFRFDADEYVLDEQFDVFFGNINF